MSAIEQASLLFVDPRPIAGRRIPLLNDVPVFEVRVNSGRCRQCNGDGWRPVSATNSRMTRCECKLPRVVVDRKAAAAGER